MKAAPDAILHAAQARYLDALEPARDGVLAELEALAARRGEPITDPEVASFLAVVARSTGARRIVELGTNVGYGAIVLARAAGPSAKVLTVELDAALAREARAHVARAGLEGRVEVVEAEALAWLDALEGPVDLAYVDCVKRDYPAYLERLVPRLAPGGVIVADNVLWKGLVAADDVPEDQRATVDALRRFNAALVGHPLLRGVVLPLGDGVGYAVRLPSPPTSGAPRA